jgi:hypothetical protein
MGVSYFLEANRLETAMFDIEWLKGGEPIGKETIGGSNETVAVATGRRKAAATARRIGLRPDSFQLLDSSGKPIGVFSINGSLNNADRT